MLKRTVTGVILAGFLFLILWLTSFSQFIFDGLVLVFLALAAYEMIGAVKRANTNIEFKEEGEERRGYRVSAVSIIAASVAVYPLCYFFGYLGLAFIAILSVITAFIVFVFDARMNFNDFAVNVVIIFYPIILLGLLFILGNSYGMIPILLALGISLLSDAVANWIGILFGKRKIFPKISPKKTYAGCIGGLFGGALGGIVIYLIFELGKYPTNIGFTFGSIVGLPVLLYAGVGFIVAFFSEIGDLAASRVKRAVGIKDFGTVLGSHGGVMDRLDSIMFSTVCIAIIMQIISLVTGV